MKLLLSNKSMIEGIMQKIENKTMEKKIYNLIILDESGSMQSIKSQANTGGHFKLCQNYLNAINV